MDLIEQLLKFLKENSWKTVHYTHKTEEYGRMKGLLNDNGIITKTKSNTLNDSTQQDGFGTSYDLLVKLNDYHKAQKIISKERR